MWLIPLHDYSLKEIMNTGTKFTVLIFSKTKRREREKEENRKKIEGTNVILSSLWHFLLLTLK